MGCHGFLVDIVVDVFCAANINAIIAIAVTGRHWKPSFKR